LILCAKTGVNRLHVAGSLLRSYTADENVSYTDRLLAKASRFAGEVADLWGIEGDDEAMVSDKVGADEFRAGCWNIDFSEG